MDTHGQKGIYPLADQPGDKKSSGNRVAAIALPVLLVPNLLLPFIFRRAGYNPLRDCAAG